MKIYKDGHEVFIENGSYRLRVGFMGETTSPKTHPGKVIKMYGIKEVVCGKKELNPIHPGNAIALQFPQDKAHLKEYEWPKGEVAQVPDFKIAMDEAPVPVLIKQGKTT